MGNNSLFIERSVGSGVIHQRPRDGYINATELCKACGKNLGNYTRNSNTKAFLEALSRSMRIRIDLLVQIIDKGDNKGRGTWVHPQVAVNLAQWASPDFAVLVTGWVVEWASGNITSYMPPHVKRYIKNRKKIPRTHFSMLNEVYLSIFSDLEDEG